jgi:hypothetical protein
MLELRASVKAPVYHSPSVVCTMRRRAAEDGVQPLWPAVRAAAALGGGDGRARA